jgi:hypothetical protein
VSQSGKNRHEDIMESLELFGREVLPEFMDRAEAAERDKATRLRPVIDAVMARKPAEDHPPMPAEDYSFPAIPRAMADRSGSDDFHKLLDAVADDTAAGDGSMIANALG